MIKQTERIKEICAKLDQLKGQLFEILVNKETGVALCHNPLRDAIVQFNNSITPKPTIDQKAQLNQKIRQNIKDFINVYVAPKIKNIIQRNDPYYFVEQMNQLWDNYQRFVFAHDYATYSMERFYEGFIRMSIAKKYERDGQVIGIPAIGINELKQFFTNKTQKNNIVTIFPKHFSNFIAKEREGTSVPRDKVKQSISAIQSCYFDFEAMFRFDINRKPCIVRNPKGTQSIARRSTDAKYFQTYIINAVIEDCERFYEKIVHEKSPILTPTDQIQLMTKIINEEESRSVFYIHTPENQKKYIDTVNRVLIGLDLNSRIQKQEGLIKYLREYQPEKPEYKTELIKFWKVYSRVLNVSLPNIVKIYSNYLDEEAVIAEQKLEKFGQFVPQMIRINTKNIQIMEFFGGNFDLENKRNEKIRGILSNEIVKQSKLKGKHTLGASNLALFINTKFKEIYVKGLEGNEEIINNLIMLFKILQEKVHFTKQYEKFIASRLLEDVDFSKDDEYTTIINLEKRFIEQMQKQMGVSEVKELLQNIKDIEKSVDHTKKIKEKLGTQIHILNQIIVKNNTFWPQKNTYDIAPPNAFLKVANEVQAYFSKTSNIQFEYNNGVSLFRGDFKSKVPKQNFHLKNIYLMILFILDECEGKKILYGDLKSRIKSYGSKKEKGNLELARNVVQLLHNGMILSSTKVLSKDDPKCIRLNESDQFELNREFDYEEQQKKNKVPSKMIKKVPVIKTSNLVMTTPDWVKKMFTQESNEIQEDQVNIEKGRRVRVKQISVKFLKHAHTLNKDVTFQQIFGQYAAPANKQFKVTEKYLKEVIQELINDDYCERVEGQRNLFKYRA